MIHNDRMNANPISVLLVDDHLVVRSGCRRLLERRGRIKVVAETETGEEACELYRTHTPDVVIMDLSLPGMGGMEAARRILAHEPKARILLFTIHNNALLAERAMQGGAMGYITKASSADVIVSAVEKVARGEKVLGPEVAHALALKRIGQEDSPLACLAAREFELFELITWGHSGAEIAQTLHLSPKTVSNYLHRIKQKLDISTTAEMVHLAIRHGIYKP